MPISLTNAGVVFNDSTTQTTAGSQATLSNLQSANASISAGAVGSYAFLGYVVNANVDVGSTFAGSDLRYGGITQDDNDVGILSGRLSGTPAGTWCAMGSPRSTTTGYFPTTIFLRIS